MPQPNLSEVPAFYHGYIGHVTEDDVEEAIRQNTTEAIPFLQQIPEEKWDYRYAEGKWSVKEMVQHIIDAERIFCYRALCFARRDATPLPGFDENSFAAASKADKRSKEDLLLEFEIVRKASELLFNSFDEEQLNATGTANQNTISVNAIGFIVAGHVKHHIRILQQRYL